MENFGNTGFHESGYFQFVNKHKTALLLSVKDKGTAELEQSCPEHTDIYYRLEEIPLAEYQLLITVGPWEYDAPIPTLQFYPPVLHIGVGCKKNVLHKESAFI